MEKKNEKKNNKKELVKMLLKKEELNDKDEEELIDLLIEQPLSIDIDKQEEAKKTFGDHVADKVSEIAGSWGFIIGFSGFLLLWIIMNGVMLLDPIDPYPFILLNLLLSCLAALQAPVIMMSQNRQAEKDSLRNQNDYRIDLKSELILEELAEKIDKVIANQNKLQREIEKLKGEKDDEETI
ncbi:MAG: DUF1003 domain-containing protein [Bacilli bacterium]|nr:DUF1003 domain-containing protein [Bacilli bacterium]